MCRVCSDFASRWTAGNVIDSYGAIAQLVERFHGMEEAGGSIPPSSTTQESCEGPVTDWSLGGFVAGEGSFGVTRKLPPFTDGSPRSRFVFTIEVAARDRALLERLQLRLGVGSVADLPARRAGWLSTSRLVVNSLRAHRRAVIPFMDAHLLPGHKRRQFELWVHAMDTYELHHPSRWGNGPSTCCVDGCERPVRGRGLCRSHYYRETGH